MDKSWKEHLVKVLFILFFWAFLMLLLTFISGYTPSYNQGAIDAHRGITIVEQVENANGLTEWKVTRKEDK